MQRTKIAVVEDEPDILEVMVYNIRREKYHVISTMRGDEAIGLIEEHKPSLLILDLMLPGMDGLEICRRLKADADLADLAIIIVSAKGEERDIVAGLELGADDYICKPFSPRELMARINAVLRRSYSGSSQVQGKIVLQGFSIDSDRHEVKVDGKPVSLTATEFRIIYQLANQPGRAFTREQLLDCVVGESIVVDRNIDVHVRSIRKKLGVKSDLIETIRGIGYRFRDNSEKS